MIRSLPNGDWKQWTVYDGSCGAAYMTCAAVAWLRDACHCRHLLVDLPSVDRMDDGGALLAHREFWRAPPAALHSGQPDDASTGCGDPRSVCGSDEDAGDDDELGEDGRVGTADRDGDDDARQERYRSAQQRRCALAAAAAAAKGIELRGIRLGGQRAGCTITELCYVADHVPDGVYRLSLQLAPFDDLDAVPSRPILTAARPA